jgi:hypothetical protein
VENVPNYEKMYFIVGKNEVLYKIFDAMNSENNIINIYNFHNIYIAIIDIFIDIICEYYKERIPYLEQPNNYYESQKDLGIPRKNSNFSGFMTPPSQEVKKFKSENNLSNYNFSHSFYQGQNKNSIHFEVITLSKEDQEGGIKGWKELDDIKDNDEKKFIIKAIKIDEDKMKEYFKSKDLKQCQIIIFTENIIEKEKLSENKNLQVYNIDFGKLTYSDYKIQTTKEKGNNNGQLIPLQRHPLQNLPLRRRTPAGMVQCPRGHEDQARADSQSRHPPALHLRRAQPCLLR